MSDRKSRVEDLLAPASLPKPPPDLLGAIQREIPDQIGSGETRRSFRGAWLVAAALLLVAGGGWLTSVLLRAPDHRTVTDGGVFSAEKAGEPLGRTMRETAPPEIAESAAIEWDRTADEGVGSTGLRSELEGPVSPAPPPRPMVAEVSSAAEPVREDFEASPSPFAPETSFASGTTTVAAAAAPPPPAVAEIDRDARPGSEALAADAEESVVQAATAKVAGGRAAATRAYRGEIDAVQPLEDAVPAVEPEPEPRTSWETIREHLGQGALPPPEAVDVDALISRFDYGDRPPRRSGTVSLFVEGGAAGLDPGRRKIVRVGLRAAPARGAVATEAMLQIDFNPEVVSLYRRIGTDVERQPGDEPATIEIGAIDSDEALSWLFEVHLLPDVRLDHVVTTASLSYLPPDGDAPLQLARSLNVGHVGRHTSSRSLRTAALAGAWAELLAGIQPDISLADLSREASDLRRMRGEPGELAGLVLETVRIIGRR
jgi:hypothetical protein